MQLSALRYFLEVARLGSIRQAAEELHVAASAISRQIANLEYEYGAALFERHAQGVRLTLPGEVFAQHARTTLRAFESVQSRIDDIQGLKRGNIRISVAEGVISNFLFATMAEFSEQYPNITFDINVAGTQEILDRVADDEADIGIVFNPFVHPDIKLTAEISHPLVLVVPPGHPLIDREVVRLSDLQGYKIGMLPRSFGTRQLLDKALAKRGVELRGTVSINSIEMMKAFVSAGLGLSVLPLFSLTRQTRGAELVAIVMDEDILKVSNLAICIRRDRQLSAAAERMHGVLVERLPIFFA